MLSITHSLSLPGIYLPQVSSHSAFSKPAIYSRHMSVLSYSFCISHYLSRIKFLLAFRLLLAFFAFLFLFSFLGESHSEKSTHAAVERKSIEKRSLNEVSVRLCPSVFPGIKGHCLPSPSPYPTVTPGKENHVNCHYDSTLTPTSTGPCINLLGLPQ